MRQSNTGNFLPNQYQYQSGVFQVRPDPLAFHRQIPTCREYLLVSQKEPRIEQFIRQANGEWTLKEAAGLSAEIKLPSLGIVLQLQEIFAKVQFAPVRLRPST